MPSNQEIVLTLLGTLSILPRELRDGIYRHVHNHRYYLTPYPRTSRLKWQPYDNAVLSLSMLAVSKTIRQEFLAIIHAEGEFIIWEEPFVKEWFPRAWTRNDIPFIRQIQNVELFTSVHAWSRDFYIANGMDYSRENDTSLKTDAVAISFFTGTEILRKTCIIKFVRPWAPGMIQMLESPFFDVLKNLTGFATVVLQVLSYEGNWRAEEVLTYIGEDPLYTNCAVGFRVIVDAMSMVLQSTLGPSAISFDKGNKPLENEWKITFHPQRFISKKKDLGTCSISQVNEANEA